MAKHLFDKAFRDTLDELVLAVRRIRIRRRRHKQRGTGQEFADHRDYVPGDDTRYIDWAVYGRLQKLVLRIFESEEPTFVYFLLDCSRSMTLGNPPRFDYARRLVAALGYVALSLEGHVSVLGFSESVDRELAPSTGQASMGSIFEFLESLKPQGPTRLEGASRDLAHGKRRRGLVIIVSDFFELDDFEGAVSRLRFAKFDVLSIQLLDPLEIRPRHQRLVKLHAAESPRTTKLVLTPEACRRYGELLVAFRERLGRQSARHEAGFVSASTETPIQELVLGLFRQGVLARI